MNKRDRENMAALIASWEWSQARTTSEAAAYGQCARTLIDIFEIAPEDLSFHRAWKLYKLTKAEDDDAYFDSLSDAIDASYSAVIDMVEAEGLSGFRAAFKKRCMP